MKTIVNGETYFQCELTNKASPTALVRASCPFHHPFPKSYTSKGHNIRIKDPRTDTLKRPPLDSSSVVRTLDNADKLPLEPCLHVPPQQHVDRVSRRELEPHLHGRQLQVPRVDAAGQPVQGLQRQSRHRPRDGGRGRRRLLWWSRSSYLWRRCRRQCCCRCRWCRRRRRLLLWWWRRRKLRPHDVEDGSWRCA